MSDSRSSEVSRRDFFSLTLSGAAGLLVPREGGALSHLGRELEALAQCDAGEVPGGRLTGIVPFSDAGGVRFGVLSGRGLDARLLTDLSTLESDRLVTPNDSFYVRTEAPASMDDRWTWKITLSGLVRRPVEVALPDLLPEASERGPYVMECAGNGSGGAFGLMSAAPVVGYIDGRRSPTGGGAARRQPRPGLRRGPLSTVRHIVARRQLDLHARRTAIIRSVPCHRDER